MIDYHFPYQETPETRRSSRSRREPQRLLSRDSKTSSDKTSTNSRSEEWKYNDGGASTSSESDEEIVEKAPPSKRIGARLRATAVRKKPTRKTKTSFTSDDDTSDGYSEEENRRAFSRRAVTATVSYKEDSDDKTDSEDLLEVENLPEPTEPVVEEKCETIEKVLAQRRGRKGGK